MSDFAVLRVAKINSLKGLSGASAHNSRTASVGLDHVHNDAQKMGGGAHLLGGQDDAVEAWHERSTAVGLKRPRKDAVRAIEAVMSVSSEWFARASQEDMDAWRHQSMAWATDTFGAENILSAHLHDDEETPHIHFLVIPLIKKDRKKAGRPRKGREGKARKPAASWGLSAADFIGSPDKLTALQTDYATRVSGLGIRRGRPKRTTGAQHTSAAAYRAKASESAMAAEDARYGALDALSSAKGVKLFAAIDAEETVAAAKLTAMETAKAFTSGLDAIDAGQLTYQPASERDREGLVINRVEKPVLPSDKHGLNRWKEAIKPMIGTLVSYAFRIAKFRSKEKDLSERSAYIEKREQQTLRDAEAISEALMDLKKTDPKIEAMKARRRQVTR